MEPTRSRLRTAWTSPAPSLLTTIPSSAPPYHHPIWPVLTTPTIFPHPASPLQSEPYGLMHTICSPYPPCSDPRKKTTSTCISFAANGPETGLCDWPRNSIMRQNRDPSSSPIHCSSSHSSYGQGIEWRPFADKSVVASKVPFFSEHPPLPCKLRRRTWSRRDDGNRRHEDYG